MNEHSEEEQESPEVETPEAAPDEAPEAEDAADSDQQPEADSPESEPRPEELQAQVADLDDKWRRAVAELENLRRRTGLQEEKARKFAIAGFAKDILAVADNLQRALEHVPADALESDETIKALHTGVEMTEKALAQALERFGVNAVAARDQLFDPRYHEAMFEIPNTEVPEGTVLEVLETGYMIHDRLLRPARVGVSKGGPKPQAASEGEETTQQDDAESQAGTQAYDAEEVEAGATLNEEI